MIFGEGESERSQQRRMEKDLSEREKKEGTMMGPKEETVSGRGTGNKTKHQRHVK